MAEYGASAAVSDPELAAKLDAWQYDRSNNPREYYTNLRAQCPVDFEQHRGAAGDGVVAAVMNRADIEEVLRNTEIFSSVMGIMGSEEPVIPLGVDPPLQAMYRRVLDPLFSPKKMAALQPTVAAQVNGMIDALLIRAKWSSAKVWLFRFLASPSFRSLAYRAKNSTPW
jgi:cytochrome P450